MVDSDSADPADEIPHRTVLLVEDDEDFALYFRRLAHKLEGVEVRVERDERAALQALTESEYDVIVSDYNLNPGNGIRLLERARDIQPNASRVLVTLVPEKAVRAEPSALSITDQVWDKAWATDTIRGRLSRLLLPSR